MHLNQKKTLRLIGRLNSDEHLRTLTIDGAEIPTLEKEDKYKYLWIKVGQHNRQNVHEI